MPTVGNARPAVGKIRVGSVRWRFRGDRCQGYGICNGGMPEGVPRGRRMKVLINLQWCKGCGVCVAFCRSGALSLDGDDSAWSGNVRSLPAFLRSPDRDNASLLAAGLYLRGQIYQRFCPVLPPVDNPAPLIPSTSRAQSHGNVSGFGAVKTVVPAAVRPRWIIPSTTHQKWVGPDDEQ